MQPRASAGPVFGVAGLPDRDPCELGIREHQGARQHLGHAASALAVEVVGGVEVLRGFVGEAPACVEVDDGLALESFLDQFYAGDRDLPRELLVPVALEDSIGLEELWRERWRGA